MHGIAAIRNDEEGKLVTAGRAPVQSRKSHLPVVCVPSCRFSSLSFFFFFFPSFLPFDIYSRAGPWLLHRWVFHAWSAELSRYLFPFASFIHAPKSTHFIHSVRFTSFILSYSCIPFRWLASFYFPFFHKFFCVQCRSSNPARNDANCLPIHVAASSGCNHSAGCF